jgi:hypothetical protein
MSNATVVIIDFVVWRARARKEAGVEDVRLEQIIDLVAHLSRKATWNHSARLSPSPSNQSMIQVPDEFISHLWKLEKTHFSCNVLSHQTLPNVSPRHPTAIWRYPIDLMGRAAARQECG